MENILIQIFNHPSRNGRIYIADSKEDVLKVFGGFIEENKSSLLLMNTVLSKDYDSIPIDKDEEFFKKFATIEISDTVGIFKDIKIIETGDIGYNEKPIFEVRGNLNFLDNDKGDLTKSLVEEKVCSIGMRSIGQHKLGFGKETFEIEKVIGFDLINIGK